MSRPKSKEMDLTVGNPFWSLLKFAIPVILGNLFQLFYTLADSVIVGKTLGADSLAAVGATSIIIYFVFCFINGFTGTNTFSYISQQQKKAIHHSFVDTERNTVPTTSTKPISSTTVNLVPRTNAERIVAAICILLIRFLFQTAITIAIKTTFRL